MCKFTTFFFLLTACTQSQGSVQDDGPLKERVLTEYPAALKRLEERLSRIHIEGTSVHTQLDPRTKKEQRTSIHYVFAINGPSRLKRSSTSSGTGGKDEGYHFVSCINPRYSFRLRAIGTGRPLEIKDFGGGLDPNVANDMGSDFARYVFAPITFKAMSIAETMAHPTFELKHVSEEIHNGKKFLKIEFRWHPVQKYPAIPGWWLVSPEEDWVLREWEFLVGRHEDVTWHGRVEYADSVDGIPLPISLSETHPLETRQFSFDRVRPGPVPESEFTLTAFGLPELDQPGRSRSTMSPGLWFLALGCLFLAIAGVLGRRWRSQGTRRIMRLRSERPVERGT